MRNLRLMLICLFVTSIMGTSAWSQEKRVALVVGVSEYQALDALNYPRADADKVAKSLTETGFQVNKVLDPTKVQFDAAVKAFVNNISEGSIAFFYYSGHGMQFGGENFMAAVDATPSQRGAAAAKLSSVSLSELINQMDRAGSRLQIIALDACRDNPFSAGSTSRGWAAVNVTKNYDRPPNLKRIVPQLDKVQSTLFTGKGTMVHFATAPGDVAEDTGAYAEILSQELLRPGVRVEETFRRIGDAIREKTANRQVPWMSVSALPAFYFVERTPDELAWGRVDKQSTAEIRRFLLEFPDSSLVRDAKTSIEKLEQERWRSLNRNSISEIDRFLQEFPGGVYTTEAQQLLGDATAESAWSRIDRGSAESVKQFIGQYPRSRHANEANELLRELTRRDTCERAWSETRKRYESSLRRFIERHSKCSQVSEAESLLEDIEDSKYSTTCSTRFCECEVTEKRVGSNCGCTCYGAYGNWVNVYGRIVKED